MKFILNKKLHLFVFSVLFFETISAQYFVSLDTRVAYTLVHQKYIQKENNLRYKFENGATYSIGLMVGYQFRNRNSLSLDFSWSEYDFAKRATSSMDGGSYYFASYGSVGHYITPIFGVNYNKEWQVSRKNSISLGGGLGIGYFIDNQFTIDTANFNTFTWRFYNNINEMVLVDEIKKGSKWVPLFRIMGGYKVSLGRRFYFTPTIMYQLGFSDFITFQYRLQYKNEARYTIVENSLRGSNLQLLLKFEYQFKKNQKERYLMRY